MQHSLRPFAFTRRSATLATFAVVALLLGAVLVPLGGPAPASNAPAGAPAPSYQALRPVLEAGEAKGLQDGAVDIFQIHSPLPTGWIWAVSGTGGEPDVEYWALHTTFLPPGEEDTDYVPSEDPVPASLEAFVAWIVAKYPHVMSEDDLDIQMKVLPLLR